MLDEHLSWFKDLFFIQWTDWRLQHMFRGVSDAIKRDRFNSASEHVRNRLIFDACSEDCCVFCLVWAAMCYGCWVNHSSQIWHECLYEIPEFFDANHYDKIMKTDRFSPATRLSLWSCCLWDKVTGAVDSLLIELKPSLDVEQALSEAFSSLMHDDDYAVRPALLSMIGNYWSGNHKI